MATEGALALEKNTLAASPDQTKTNGTLSSISSPTRIKEEPIDTDGVNHNPNCLSFLPFYSVKTENDLELKTEQELDDLPVQFEAKTTDKSPSSSLSRPKKRIRKTRVKRELARKNVKLLPKPFTTQGSFNPRIEQVFFTNWKKAASGVPQKIGIPLPASSSNGLDPLKEKEVIPVVQPVLNGEKKLTPQRHNSTIPSSSLPFRFPTHLTIQPSVMACPLSSKQTINTLPSLPIVPQANLPLLQSIPMMNTNTPIQLSPSFPLVFQPPMINLSPSNTVLFPPIAQQASSSISMPVNFSSVSDQNKDTSSKPVHTVTALNSSKAGNGLINCITPISIANQFIFLPNMSSATAITTNKHQSTSATSILTTASCSLSTLSIPAISSSHSNAAIINSTQRQTNVQSDKTATPTILTYISKPEKKKRRRRRKPDLSKSYSVSSILSAISKFNSGVPVPISYSGLDFTQARQANHLSNMVSATTVATCRHQSTPVTTRSTTTVSCSASTVSIPTSYVSTNCKSISSLHSDSNTIINFSAPSQTDKTATISKNTSGSSHCRISDGKLRKLYGKQDLSKIDFTSNVVPDVSKSNSSYLPNSLPSSVSKSGICFTQAQQTPLSNFLINAASSLSVPATNLSVPATNLSSSLVHQVGPVLNPNLPVLVPLHTFPMTGDALSLQNIPNSQPGNHQLTSVSSVFVNAANFPPYIVGNTQKSNCSSSMSSGQATSLSSSSKSMPLLSSILSLSPSLQPKSAEIMSVASSALPPYVKTIQSSGPSFHASSNKSKWALNPKNQDVKCLGIKLDVEEVMKGFKDIKPKTHTEDLAIKIVDVVGTMVTPKSEPKVIGSNLHEKALPAGNGNNTTSNSMPKTQLYPSQILTKSGIINDNGLSQMQSIGNDNVISNFSEDKSISSQPTKSLSKVKTDSDIMMLMQLSVKGKTLQVNSNQSNESSSALLENVSGCSQDAEKTKDKESPSLKINNAQPRLSFYGDPADMELLQKALIKCTVSLERLNLPMDEIQNTMTYYNHKKKKKKKRRPSGEHVEKYRADDDIRFEFQMKIQKFHSEEDDLINQTAHTHTNKKMKMSSKLGELNVRTSIRNAVEKSSNSCFPSSARITELDSRDGCVEWVPKEVAGDMTVTSWMRKYTGLKGSNINMRRSSRIESRPQKDYVGIDNGIDSNDAGNVCNYAQYENDAWMHNDETIESRKQVVCLERIKTVDDGKHFSKIIDANEAGEERFEIGMEKGVENEETESDQTLTQTDLKQGKDISFEKRKRQNVHDVRIAHSNETHSSERIETIVALESTQELPDNDSHNFIYSSESESDLFDAMEDLKRYNKKDRIHKTQFLMKRHNEVTTFLLNHTDKFSTFDEDVDKVVHICNECKVFRTNGFFRLVKHLKDCHSLQ